jgi:hypothetical protein
MHDCWLHHRSKETWYQRDKQYWGHYEFVYNYILLSILFKLICSWDLRSSGILRGVTYYSRREQISSTSQQKPEIKVICCFHVEDYATEYHIKCITREKSTEWEIQLSCTNLYTVKLSMEQFSHQSLIFTHNVKAIMRTMPVLRHHMQVIQSKPYALLTCMCMHASKCACAQRSTNMLTHSP